jgi:hypothetical protein
MRACYEVWDDQVPIAPDWLASTQKALFQKWSTTTGHRPGAGSGTWACEIASRCRTCQEHLSLPCSLLAEGNEIAAILKPGGYAEEPALFLRLYLFILSEFVAQLNDTAGLMNLKIGKGPSAVCIWANRWGKHRLRILLQHHPVMAFADEYGPRWPGVEQRLRREPLTDRCGNTQPIRIIDTAWLMRHDADKLSAEANGPGRALILVPPMMDFLDCTFRDFLSNR